MACTEWVLSGSTGVIGSELAQSSGGSHPSRRAQADLKTQKRKGGVIGMRLAHSLRARKGSSARRALAWARGQPGARDGRVRPQPLG